MKSSLMATVAVIGLTGVAGLSQRAAAQTPAPAPAAPAAAAPAAPAAPTSNALSTPSMGPSISANPNPFSVDLGSILGKTYVSGQFTGLAFGQSDPVPQEFGFPGDRRWEGDLSNGMAEVQKTDGLIQYFIQAGIYSFPTVGVPYTDAAHTNSNLFGPVPEAYVKVAPTDSFSIEAGKLPTLIGQESTFTFQNINIERGLLWNQENLINRGLQANYTVGPLAFAVSWNDGFYSNDYTYFTGSVTWTVDSANTLVFAGGGNVSNDTVVNSATPIFAQNEQQFDVSWTWANGPWSINPYAQYTYVPTVNYDGADGFGTVTSASTWGGSLLINYAFDSSTNFMGMSLGGFSLPARLEYILSTGSHTTGANLLGYGAGSEAWSLTITPTYQYKVFFARTEFSYTNVGGLNMAGPSGGFAFGKAGNDTNQYRALVEAGFVF